ncbi:hypothetical protein [Halalkalicoccus sp. NIPERK01]|uniref:hypothetical protein n=1 Tax=Halalkalicoccus sp. NIPERK01 TaxID=3053469 RepID=UPI00256EFC14|nr:hypothetical protein [Halalkalicoccus sp. NIPERK01]MDL5362304.1 hypothetical protein [Halalkalicoccus sp. NIPERK01]
MYDTPDRPPAADARESHPTNSTSTPLSRRNALRSVGVAAGLLAAVGTTRPATAEDDSADACDDPDEPTDPDELYVHLLARQRELRASNGANLDEDGVRTVLEERAADFEGRLLFFAASDFGQPRVFLPADLSDPDAVLQSVLDRIHAEKWSPEHDGLRDVRRQVFEEVAGIHQGLPALYHGSGEAEYDLAGPWDGVYNFVTIRQVVGLVDWVTNADEEWVEGRRLTYDSPESADSIDPDRFGPSTHPGLR